MITIKNALYYSIAFFICIAQATPLPARTLYDKVVNYDEVPFQLDPNASTISSGPLPGMLPYVEDDADDADADNDNGGFFSSGFFSSGFFSSSDSDYFTPKEKLTLGATVGAGIIAGAVAAALCSKKGPRGHSGSNGSSGHDGMVGGSGSGGGSGPELQQSHAGLIITYFADELQTNSAGTYQALIVLPDQSELVYDAVFGPGANPLVITLNAPTLVGTYSIGFRLASLTSTPPMMVPMLDPIITVQNTKTNSINTFFLNPSVFVGSQVVESYINEPG